MKLSPNEIDEEKNRVKHEKYKKFIKRVTLRGVRGFKNQTIEFRYPVTGLIGTNGGGKSTILGATALAYKNVKPGQFFPKACIGDNSMSNWTIEYELVDKPTNKQSSLVRTARFSQTKWRRENFPDREYDYIEIQRTVPAGEINRFRRFIGQNNDNITEESLSEETIKFASAVLDKDISHYRIFREKDNPHHLIYVGKHGDIEYSQFHFGAGEASIIATIDRIERVSENALILIEEIENGLHPVAVRLFINYLENASRRKRLQVVFTTHSQDAIDELPEQAIWASINKKTWNGRLTIDGLRAITGRVSQNKVVFVEDNFAKEWLEAAIGRYGGEEKHQMKVFPGGGYPNLLAVCEYHNSNPSIEIPAVALVDGDQYDPETAEALPNYAYFLGGGIPETTVFDYIFDNREELSGIIQQRCLLSKFDQQRIVRDIESTRNSACDPHSIFRRLGEKLDFTSEIKIRDGMIDIFNENNRAFWEPTLRFLELLPAETSA